MNYTQDIKPISYIKTNAADVLKQINETRRPIIITQNGHAKGVFVDTRSYEKLQKTIGILKILSIGENQIEKNKIHNDTDIYKNIEKKLL